MVASSQTVAVTFGMKLMVDGNVGFWPIAIKIGDVRKASPIFILMSKLTSKNSKLTTHN